MDAGPGDPGAGAAPAGAVRVDLFLDVACLFPTRSQARKACEAGHVEVRGARAKPSAPVRVGDEIALRSRGGVRRTFVVLALSERHLPRAQARALYRETTPAPSAEELAWRRVLAAGRPRREPGAGRPTKRERRETDRLRGR